MITKIRSRVVAVTFVAGVALLVAAAWKPLVAFAAEPVERFTATAVNMTGIGRAGAGTLVITIDRWSTEAERDRLLTTLMEQGPDALYDKLKDTPSVGRIRTPTSLGWDLHYARSVDRPDGTRQVVIATDRPMGFREVANQARTVDYKFTVIDIRFGPDGKGVGKLNYATKITVNERTKTIELENFGIEPVRLTDVRSSKPAKS